MRSAELSPVGGTLIVDGHSRVERGPAVSSRCAASGRGLISTRCRHGGGASQASARRRTDTLTALPGPRALHSSFLSLPCVSSRPCCRDRAWGSRHLWVCLWGPRLFPRLPFLTSTVSGCHTPSLSLNWPQYDTEHFFSFAFVE